MNSTSPQDSNANECESPRGRPGFPTIITGALALLLAAVLTFAIRSNDLLPFEKAVSDWMAANSGWVGEALAESLDLISDDDVAPFVFIGALLVTWALVGRYQAVFLGFAGLLTAATKLTDLADRPRPDADGGWTSAVTGGGGFPSQHVIYAILIFGFLALYSWRHVSNPLLRFTLTGFFTLIVATMGVARIIDGEHWPADAVGGYLIGGAAFLALHWLYPRLHVWLERLSPILFWLATGRRITKRTNRVGQAQQRHPVVPTHSP